MTEYRARTIQQELEKMRNYCFSHDGDGIRIQLIDYMQEIIESLPKTK